MWLSSRTDCHTEIIYHLGIDFRKDDSHVAVLNDDAGVVEAILVALAGRRFCRQRRIRGWGLDPGVIFSVIVEAAGAGDSSPAFPVTVSSRTV